MTNVDLKILLHVRVHIKTIPKILHFLILSILKLFAREVCKSLKSWLIFNIFCCFWIFLNVSHVRISQKVKVVLMWNLQHILLIWREREREKERERERVDFQICISVPLKCIIASTVMHLNLTPYKNGQGFGWNMFSNWKLTKILS